jgi:ribosomal protein L15
LGVSTGAGGEAIRQAFEAGQKGGKAAEQFRVNITGQANPKEILNIAKSNLDELNRLKQEEYRSGMVNIKNDKSILAFDDIDKSLTNAEKKVTFNKQIVNKSAAEKISEAKGLVDNWKSLDPAIYHTPEGLDALKKQIGDVLEGIPFEQRVARSSIGDIYNSVKSTIQKQAPAYANTMKAYTEATDQIREIERALSIGKKSSVDTAVRKLQSLVRDNVQTNYGQRVALGKQLEEMGGQQFMPGVAGQALSSFPPRGISGALSLPTGLGGYALGGIPGAIGSTALASPRLVGETAYGLGAASRGAREFGTLVPPAVDPRLYNVLYQSGQMEGLLGQ